MRCYTLLPSFAVCLLANSSEPLMSPIPIDVWTTGNCDVTEWTRCPFGTVPHRVVPGEPSIHRVFYLVFFCSRIAFDFPSLVRALDSLDLFLLCFVIKFRGLPCFTQFPVELCCLPSFSFVFLLRDLSELNLVSFCCHLTLQFYLVLLGFIFSPRFIGFEIVLLFYFLIFSDFTEFYWLCLALS